MRRWCQASERAGASRGSPVLEGFSEEAGFLRTGDELGSWGETGHWKGFGEGVGVGVPPALTGLSERSDWLEAGESGQGAGGIEEQAWWLRLGGMRAG